MHLFAADIYQFFPKSWLWLPRALLCRFCSIIRQIFEISRLFVVFKNAVLGFTCWFLRACTCTDQFVFNSRGSYSWLLLTISHLHHLAFITMRTCCWQVGTTFHRAPPVIGFLSIPQYDFWLWSCRRNLSIIPARC